MMNRPLLFRRWTGENWNSRTLLTESLKKLTAKMGKSQFKRYALSVVGVIDAHLVPELEAEPLTQDDILNAMGAVSLSHFDGWLANNLPLRELCISNDIEGYFPVGKRDLIVPDDGYEAEEIDLQHVFILAYADRWHAQGQVDEIERVEGAKPLSLMGGDSEFQLQLRDLPDLWTCPDGMNLSVFMWIHETEGELVDRPTRLVRSTDLKDPIPLPYAFKKAPFIALVADLNKEIGFAGQTTVVPRLEVDGDDQLDKLNALEIEIARRSIRPDGDSLGANGLAAGTLLGRTTFVVTDPFEADKRTLFNYGHDQLIWGDLQAAQQESGNGKLTLLCRLYEDASANAFAVQMSRDNISTADRKNLMVGGQLARSHRWTRGEALGVQPKIKTRAEMRQPAPAEVE